jgi:hypothetical protein
MTDPSNKVHDQFRSRSAGVVRVPSNSKPANDDFHIDRSRLGVHEEYDPEAKNDWGGTGRFVERQNSITDNARASAGDIRACASYKNVHDPEKPTNSDCMPCAPFPGRFRQNPINRRGGDE